MTDTSKWKGAWLARVDIMGGGCWARSHESKQAALEGLARQLKADWSGLFKIDEALVKGIEVAVYKDAGTKSWEDDEFIETVKIKKVGRKIEEVQA